MCLGSQLRHFVIFWRQGAICILWFLVGFDNQSVQSASESWPCDTETMQPGHQTEQSFIIHHPPGEILLSLCKQNRFWVIIFLLYILLWREKERQRETGIRSILRTRDSIRDQSCNNSDNKWRPTWKSASLWCSSEKWSILTICHPTNWHILNIETLVSFTKEAFYSLTMSFTARLTWLMKYYLTFAP